MWNWGQPEMPKIRRWRCVALQSERNLDFVAKWGLVEWRWAQKFSPRESNRGWKLEKFVPKSLKMQQNSIGRDVFGLIRLLRVWFLAHHPFNSSKQSDKGGKLKTFAESCPKAILKHRLAQNFEPMWKIHPKVAQNAEKFDWAEGCRCTGSARGPILVILPFE